jgi:putative N6-adenine-specific DNA methylase
MNNEEERTIIAKTFYGLEDVLANEVRSLGVKDIEILNRAVKYKGDKSILYKSNLLLRTALRILVPIEEFNVDSYDQLYNKSSQVEWDEYFTPYHTFFINSFVNSRNIDHSHFAALKLKDSIADYFRKKYNIRPSIEKENPDYRINLHIFKDRCTISMDSSGESLHKRGYKVENVEAPLSEVLAAGMIILSGWDMQSPFIDPMCGSGTLPIEAALMAYDIPPGKFRKDFGFTRWNDYDGKLHKKILDEYIPDKINQKIKIAGSDISEKAILKCKKNAENAGLTNLVDFETRPIEKFQADNITKGHIIMNPPYDIKIKRTDIDQFYKKIGDTLKNNFNGFDVWIFSGNKEAIKNIGLRAKRKITLYNGPLECKYLYFPIYKGTLKNKKLD